MWGYNKNFVCVTESPTPTPAEGEKEEDCSIFMHLIYDLKNRKEKLRSNAQKFKEM